FLDAPRRLVIYECHLKRRGVTFLAQDFLASGVTPIVKWQHLVGEPGILSELPFPLAQDHQRGHDEDLLDLPLPEEVTSHRNGHKRLARALLHEESGGVVLGEEFLDDFLEGLPLMVEGPDPDDLPDLFVPLPPILAVLADTPERVVVLTVVLGLDLDEGLGLLPLATVLAFAVLVGFPSPGHPRHLPSYLYYRTTGPRV